MAPSANVRRAYKAMKDIGISEAKTKPVLKKLLQVFDKKWAPIEEENYRVLADAIFDYEENEIAEKDKKKTENTERGEASQPAALHDWPTPDETAGEEPERPLKRLRLKHQTHDAQTSSTPGVGALKIPKPEPGEPMRGSPQSRNIRVESQPVSPQLLLRNKGKQSVSSHGTRQPPAALPVREKRTMPSGKQVTALMKPKDEPYTDDTVSVEPLAVILPECLNKEASSKPANEARSQNGQISRTVEGLGNGMELIALTEQEKEKQLQELGISDGAPTTLDIAASALGEVKVSLTCSLGSKGDEMHVPDLEAVMKKVTDNCLRTYKIMDPEFSVTGVMKQFCDYVVELGKNVVGSPEGNGEQDGQVINNSEISIIPSVDSSLNGEFSEVMTITNDVTLADNCSPPLTSICSDIDMQSKENVTEDNSSERDASVDDVNLKSILVVHPYDTSDITGGEETVTVPLEKSNCEFLPSFHYISRNVISDNAEVKFSLARIGDKDHCLSCNSDCLSVSSSCNCSQRDGRESLYTRSSLVKEEFLDECISMVRYPQKHYLVYCKECPLERLKNEDMQDPCKGHLKRKFIKECYTKCGCSQYCGNRVVQRGIRCNLQVFWTPEGKGWGLKTLDNLPKGAFVCEFAGEILTSMELCKRNQSRTNDKHSFSVLLDTDWGTRVFKEEELLCVDATFYGNVARFINHRCTDANLIEIPVEVETPSHHYYHVALFTTRDVNAYEELTWDYGVDFDDIDHHIKAFRCLCSSQFCRNMKRSSRSRSALNLM